MSTVTFSRAVANSPSCSIAVELGAVGEAARPGEDRCDRIRRGLLALLVLAIVPGHGAVRGFQLHHLAVRRHQHRGHQAERAETLRHHVGLHVAVIVLAGPHIAAGPFHRGRHHVVDQAMLVGQLSLVELRLEFRGEDFVEDVLEAPVVDFQDGVLGRQIDGIAARQPVIERGAREIPDRVVEIVHRHGDAAARKVEHLVLDLLAVVADEADGHLARAGHLEIGGAILVAIGVAADDDRLGPARHQPRHVLADDRLTEDDATQDVADGAVGRAPHLLEIELLHPAFVGGDGGAFHADADLFDLVGGVDRDLVVGLVALLDAQVVIQQIHIEIGVDQLVLDILPDDPGHLVAVEFDDRVLHLDFRHCGPLRAEAGESLGNGRSRARPGSGVAIASAVRRSKPSRPTAFAGCGPLL